MENATKALLIAGGILIAIVILSAGVYLYVLFSNQGKEYSQIISTVEIQKFNSKFDVYLGREDITAQEIVSVVNLAEEYDNQVEIYLGGSMLKFNNSFTQETFIKNNQKKIFKCILNNINPVYDENVKIKKLIFQYL